jgi:hypothetical protein
MNNFRKPSQDNRNPQSSQFDGNKDIDMNNFKKPSQDNRNAQNSQFNKEKPLEDNLKAPLNQLSHDKDNAMENKNQPPQEITKDQSHQFNQYKVKNMNQRLKGQPIMDNTQVQTSQLNHNPPTIETGSFTAQESPSEMHSWAKQHSMQHYRNPYVIGNGKYLPGKVTHQQHNWDKWGHFNDDWDAMGSEITSWGDQGLEGGTRDTYTDPYGDMTSEYKDGSISNDISKGYDESYKGMDGAYRDDEGMDEGIDSTYSQTSNDGEYTTSIYKDIDSKAYPKHPEGNTEYIDTTLTGQESRGLEGINGLSPEGAGVGLPLQEYTDEVGQVRGLHRKSSKAKQKLTTKH